MIVLKDQKLIFFRVPKTGSTAIRYNLINSTSLDFDNCIIPPCEGNKKVHITPQEAYDEGLLTDDMIAEYSMYAVIRNPTDRTLSAISHMASPVKMSPARMHDMVDALGSRLVKGIFAKPQVNWLKVNDETVVTPILYDTYKESLAAIYTDADIVVGDATRNRSAKRADEDEVFDTDARLEVLATLKETYADDWEVYNSLL